MRLSTGGFALSVPGLSVVLNRKGAQNVVAALTYALLATVPAEPPPTKRKRSLSPRPAKGESD